MPSGPCSSSYRYLNALCERSKTWPS
jgi:hypothetical protein